jgi:hypothetical protein
MSRVTRGFEMNVIIRYAPDIVHLGGIERYKTPNLTLISRERLECNLLNLSAMHIMTAIYAPV